MRPKLAIKIEECTEGVEGSGKQRLVVLLTHSNSGGPKQTIASR